MLRRAGHYRRTKTQPAAPEAGDDNTTLEGKWRAWVEFESFKRLFTIAPIPGTFANLRLTD
jgi:hypothetical protein